MKRSTDVRKTRGRPGPLEYELAGPQIRVWNDGLIGTWCAGYFLSDPERTQMIDEARRNIELGYRYQLFGVWVTCGDDTPMGIVAALCSYRPDRARVLEAPQDVLAALVCEDDLEAEHYVP